MLRIIIESGIRSVHERLYLTPLPECPFCQGKLSGFDTVKRKFATVIRETGTDDVTVRVRRFKCLTCGKISSALSPFYPDTRYGKPVVDLTKALLESNPANRVTVIMSKMGILIDRGTVLSYKKRNFGQIGIMDIYGFPIPLSVIELTTMEI